MRANPLASFAAAAAAVILAASVTLILNERWLILFLGGAAPHGPTFGVLADAAGDCRRRPSNEMAWQPAVRGDDVHGGDALYTSDDSEAVIEIAHGAGTLTLGPDSLMVFGSGDAVGLRQGRANGKLRSGATLRVATPQGRLSVTAPDDGASPAISLRAEGSGATAAISIGVSGARATLKSDDGERALAPGDEAEVSVSGAVTAVRARPIALLAPSDGARVLKDSTEAVTFAWRSPAGPARFHFQAAYDPGFQVRLLERDFGAAGAGAVCKPEGSGTASALACAFTVPFKAVGVVFWRVTGNTGLESPDARFALAYQAVPTPQAPGFDEVIEPGVAHFRWDDPNASPRFQFQLSREPDFEKLSQDTVVEGHNIELPIPDEGQYFWRVREQDPSGVARFSTVARFTAQRRALAGSPEPLAPSEGQVFSHTSVDFRWNGRGASSYMLEIARERDFRKTLYAETLVRATYSWQARPGLYFWRVRGADRTGHLTEFSPPRSFKVR